jgi:short-subunit dehydrogenase
MALGYKRLFTRYARADPNLPADQRSWAMVTGASDGIGLAMCKVLAEQQFNLIMVSRSKERLEQARQAVLDHLDTSHKPVQIALEVHDFAKFTDIARYQERFEPIFKSKDVAMLINNAGLGNPGPIDKLTPEEVGDMTSVNMIHPTFLTRIALDYMSKRP